MTEIMKYNVKIVYNKITIIARKLKERKKKIHKNRE